MTDTVHHQHWNGTIPKALLARLGEKPAVRDAVLGLGAALRGSLGSRTVELVALRTSAERNCLYTWRGHCQIALGRTLDKREIAAIAFGPVAFDGYDRAILEAVDEVLADRQLSTATLAKVGDRELLLLLTTMFYDVLAAVMRDAEPDELSVADLETPRVAAHWLGRWGR
jgi:AhpD family alkylhydroperoxidase